MKRYNVIVLGAGPAGLLAAGRAAEKGARVLLLEKKASPGKKLLITGHGRCNVTNKSSISEYVKCIYPNGKFLKPAFSAFFVEDICKLLTSYGVSTVIEEGNKVFPSSNRAVDVLDALVKWTKAKGAEIFFNCVAERLVITDGAICGVEVHTPIGKETNYADNVIICTGGCSYPSTGSEGDGLRLAKQAGHSIIPIVPALVPIVTEAGLTGKLQGVSISKAIVMVWLNGKKQTEGIGELMFTHYGLSGPVILNLSRFVCTSLNSNNTLEISVDLFPDTDRIAFDKIFVETLNANGKKQLANILKNWLQPKCIEVFLSESNISETLEGNKLKAPDRNRLVGLIKDLRFRVKGHRGFKEAMLTCGGINTDEINPKTMGSKKIKGLYFAGETIDIDGPSGGYNLQIAFSTGWLAGNSSADKVK